MNASSTNHDNSGDQIKPWLRYIARIGYFSKGIVYTFIGFLSLLAAMGLGGKAAGTAGMLRSLADIPLGEILIWIIGSGLIGYILWNVIRIFKKPQVRENNFITFALRARFAVTGIIYANVSFNAFNIIWQARNNIYKEKPLTERFIQQTFGQWTTGLIGLLVIGFGIYQIYKGLTGKFMKTYKSGNMNDYEKKVAIYAGKIGLTARGVVFGLIGAFFIRTAVIVGLSEPIGMDRALSVIARQPHGPWLLGIVSIGLFLYGISEIIKGRYKYMNAK